MYVMSSGNESNAKPMSTEMLEDIRGRSQYHPRINRREARYKISDSLKKGKRNGKEIYYQRETWVNVYTNYLRLLLMIFHKHCQFWVNQALNFLTSFQNLETFQK